MSEDLSQLLVAQAAIRAGNNAQARELLQAEVAQNPDNFRAWLWLAGLAESAQESLEYVRQAERLQPHDPGVRKARAWAEQRLARQTTAEAADDLSADMNDPQLVNDTAQRVEALRAQQRVTEDSAPTPRRRRLLFAGAALLVVMLLSALLWRWDSTAPDPIIGLDGNSSAADVTQATLEITTSPTSPARTESETVEISFMSGQFAPRKSEGAVSGSEADGQSQSQDEPTPTPEAVLAKPVNNSGAHPRATWTLTPSPTFTPTATATPVPTFVYQEEVVVGGAARPAGVGPNERWIDVNLTTQRLVAYEGDNAVFNSLISSGTWLHPTVTGQFRVWLRYTAQTMDGRRLGYDYYLPNVPYVMYFYRDYALHGTYWHNNFGTPMSHGCVNLPTPAAEWIFNWSSIGTLVSVHY